MARIASLNILLETTGKDFLKEEYGKVIENVQKRTISHAIKNKDLSGNPTAGSVEAKRFVNTSSKAYGTARAGGEADKIKVKPVTIQIDTDIEYFTEVEEKDVAMYGVDSIIKRESISHGKSLMRELERAFFAEGSIAGGTATLIKTVATEKLEELIQLIETTENDFVDGVERDMITVVCSPSFYGEIRNKLDTLQNANADTGKPEFGYFHGAKVESSVYLPSTDDAICLVDGAIAQPVRTTLIEPNKIQFSNAYGFGLFASYGTKAVMPDLIKVLKK